MHDLLFANQRALCPDHLVGYAAVLGLDLERFALEVEQHTHQPRIREDFMSGMRSGVNGTPTFFVNGVRDNGGYDPDSLLQAIQNDRDALRKVRVGDARLQMVERRRRGGRGACECGYESRDHRSPHVSPFPFALRSGV